MWIICAYLSSPRCCIRNHFGSRFANSKHQQIRSEPRRRSTALEIKKHWTQGQRVPPRPRGHCWYLDGAAEPGPPHDRAARVRATLHEHLQVPARTAVRAISACSTPLTLSGGCAARTQRVTPLRRRATGALTHFARANVFNLLIYFIHFEVIAS